MDNLNSPFYAVYSIRPLGIDRMIREIAPSDCVDGTMLYAYCKKKANIKLIASDEAPQIKTEGVRVWVSVPSRTDRHDRYEFEWHSVPLIDNNNKHLIALTIRTVGHDCRDKLFNKELKYGRSERDSSKRVTFCSHEIAAYLEICDYYKNHKDPAKKTIIPFQMSQFLVPSKLTARYNHLIQNNLLVRDGNELKKPNIAIRNILLLDELIKYKYRETFYASKTRDGDIADYNW